ncbi:MAG TPA: hypothetical protein VFQ61_02355 [Polyangiaceae bacterium]|nr:hypothetical protein [Polyangiaceae bacterium]
MAAPLVVICMQCADGDYVAPVACGGTRVASLGGQSFQGGAAGAGAAMDGGINGKGGTGDEAVASSGGSPTGGASTTKEDDELGGAGGSSGGASGAAGESGSAGRGGPRCPAKLPIWCLRSPDHLGSAGAPQDTLSKLRYAKALVPVENTTLNAVNARMQMAGGMRCDDGVHALMFDRGRAYDLLEAWQDDESIATDINDHGVVVGWVTLVSGDPGYPFVWADGVTMIIRGENLGTPIAINNRDQILIRGTTEQGDFIWYSGRLTPIGPSLVAYALDNLGRVVGETRDELGGIGNGFIWEEGVVRAVSGFSSVRAINDRGQLAGLDEVGLPVLWDGAQWVELGADFKMPLGVSARGLVLGQGWDSLSMVYWEGARETLYGQLSLGFVEGHGRDISTNGDIVGPAIAIRTDLNRSSNNCRDESCESFHAYDAIWRAGCFGSCCGGTQQAREYHAVGGDAGVNSDVAGFGGAEPP